MLIKTGAMVCLRLSVVEDLRFQLSQIELLLLRNGAIA